MLHDMLLGRPGLPVYIVSGKYGLRSRSYLRIESSQKDVVEPRIYWRGASSGAGGTVSSSELGCEMSLLEAISQPQPVSAGQLLQPIRTAATAAPQRSFSLTLLFVDFQLILDIVVPPDCTSTTEEFASELRSLLGDCQKRAQNFARIERERHTTKGTGEQSHSYQQTVAFRRAGLNCAVKEEQLLQLCMYLRFKEAYMIMERAVSSTRSTAKFTAFRKWVKVIHDMNNEKMQLDRTRWRLHAVANQDIDLQAWYHALFFQEVYRLRGHFWYKDAVLPQYKQSYDLVDNALTPLEEAALAHVLCSPDTTYGDVAGQMFVVQALMNSDLFTLFQQLAAQGATVVKYPRSGRPSKKLFRFSFVEGNIYLTWKGKFGNQGVGMSEVTEVCGGIESDVLKWAAQGSRPEQYLSINCVDRSVDLYFESEKERNKWRDLLRMLMAKEQGKLVGVDPVDPPEGAAEFEWLILYASIGKSRLQTL